MKKILVIDDDEGTRDVLKAAFGKGYEVVLAADGRAGAAALKAERPFLVFLDIYMPGLSGLETLELMAADIEGSEVWMLTGELELEPAEKALSSGAKGYITKPFTLDVVRKVAEDAANRADKRKPDEKSWHRAPKNNRK